MPVKTDFYCKYLSANPEDEKWQIFCTSSGVARTPAWGQYPAHPEAHPSKYCADTWEQGRILDEFALIYITNGRGRFKTEANDPVIVEAGTVLMVFPGIHHWYAPFPETGWDEYWVCFDGGYPRLLMEKGFFNPSQSLFTPGLHDEILDDFLAIIELTEKDSSIFQPELGARIIDLLALLLKNRRSSQNEQDEEEKLVEKAKFLFEERIHESIDMSDFALSLGIDYAKFRRIFKEQTNQSPYQYFLNLKIEKAKHLLCDLTTSIKEIAYSLSFENQYYFSRVFKKKTGFSPTHWQEYYLKKVLTY